MDTELMREFVVFSRYLNFSKAAGKLNLAQPTLSSHIASMERELGFELVDRSKKIRLTPAGKQFCADAERLLTSYHEVVEECKRLSRAGTGKLVFNRPIHQGGMDYEFDRILLSFRKENPGIEVHKYVSHEYSLKDILVNGIADIGFVFSELREVIGEDLVDDVEILELPQVKLGPYYLWLDESHDLASRDSVTIDELDGCRFLIPSNIRYQSLENLARMRNEESNIDAICTYWPGSYEECVINIEHDEVMIVNDYDLRDAAYTFVENRCCIPLLGFDDLIRPCLIYLKTNDNPALDVLAEFLKAGEPSHHGVFGDKC